MRLKISALASTDLREIELIGLRDFGLNQTVDYLLGLTDIVDLVVRLPNVQREREEYGQGVRMHPYEAHVLFIGLLAIWLRSYASSAAARIGQTIFDQTMYKSASRSQGFRLAPKIKG